MKVIFYKVLTLLFLLGAGHGFSQTKPNVILIMADDLGYDYLSCNGSLTYESPQLDNMASEGLRFTNCYSQPLCTPSRVKIMTGLYNYRNYEDFGYLNPNQYTFGQLMKSAGYATLVAGKWQLNGLNRNNPGKEDKNRPYHFGFDEYCLWQLTDGRGAGERYANPLIVQNGEHLPRDPDAYGPDIFSNYVLDFIERKKEQPFFIYYPMVLTHDPFVPTPDSPEWADPNQRYEEDTAYFRDMVLYMDKIVGKIRTRLQELDIADNTLLIFTADNGTYPSVANRTSERFMVGAKGSTLNDGNRVPLIINWPLEIRPGKIHNELIEFSDFFPTLADLTKKEVQSDGQSFLPLLRGEKYNARDQVFIHYDPEWGKFTPGQFVSTGKYKLYRDGRFFNLENDILEKSPLKDLSAREQKIRQTLLKELSRHPDLATRAVN